MKSNDIEAISKHLKDINKSKNWKNWKSFMKFLNFGAISDQIQWHWSNNQAIKRVRSTLIIFKIEKKEKNMMSFLESAGQFLMTFNDL